MYHSYCIIFCIIFFFQESYSHEYALYHMTRVVSLLLPRFDLRYRITLLLSRENNLFILFYIWVLHYQDAWQFRGCR